MCAVDALGDARDARRRGAGASTSQPALASLMDEPMPEPPELRSEDVAAVIRWLDESAAWLREDLSVATSHGHPAQPQVEANFRLYGDAAFLFREAYDGR